MKLGKRKMVSIMSECCGRKLRCSDIYYSTTGGDESIRSGLDYLIYSAGVLRYSHYNLDTDCMDSHVVHLPVQHPPILRQIPARLELPVMAVSTMMHSENS